MFMADGSSSKHAGRLGPFCVSVLVVYVRLGVWQKKNSFSFFNLQLEKIYLLIYEREIFCQSYSLSSMKGN